MIPARFVFASVFATFWAAAMLPFAAGRAAADHIGQSLPGMQPAGLLLTVTSVDEMPPQLRRAYVRGIQEELTNHRYDPGPPDGELGPKTYQAIRQYQQDAGLQVDGVASKELLDHLKFALPKITANPDPVPDPLVVEVQSRLKELGYYRGALDGVMGGVTREAIRAYRYDAGMPITGAIDGALRKNLGLEDTAARPGPGGAPDSSETTELPERAETAEETWYLPEPVPADQSDDPFLIVTPLPQDVQAVGPVED